MAVWAAGVWTECVWGNQVWDGLLCDHEPPQPPAQTKPYPGPAGGGKERKRKTYVIGDKAYQLTPGELQEVLAVAFRGDKPEALAKPLRKPAKALQRVVQKAPTPDTPTFQAVPAFDAVWSELMSRKQHEMAEQARAVAYAMEIEQDDADIFALIQKLPDDT